MLTEKESIDGYLPSPASPSEWADDNIQKPRAGIPNSGSSCLTATGMHVVLGALQALPVNSEFHLKNFINTSGGAEGFLVKYLKKEVEESQEKFAERKSMSTRLHKVFVAMMHQSHEVHNPSFNPQTLRGLQVCFDALMTEFVNSLGSQKKTELGILDENDFDPKQSKDVKAVFNLMFYAFGLSSEMEFSMLEKDNSVETKSQMILEPYERKNLTDNVSVTRTHRHLSKSVSQMLNDGEHGFLKSGKDPSLCMLIAEKSREGLNTDFFDEFVVDVLDAEGKVAAKRHYKPINSSVLYFGNSEPMHFVARAKISVAGECHDVVFDDSQVLDLTTIDQFGSLTNVDMENREVRNTHFKHSFEPRACMYQIKEIDIIDGAPTNVTYIKYNTSEKTFSRVMSEHVKNVEMRDVLVGPGLTLERFKAVKNMLKIIDSTSTGESGAQMIDVTTNGSYGDPVEALEARFSGYNEAASQKYITRESKPLNEGSVIPIRVQAEHSEVKQVLNVNVGDCSKATVSAIYKKILDQARSLKMTIVELPLFIIDDPRVSEEASILIAQREILEWLDANYYKEVERVVLNVGDKGASYEAAWAKMSGEGDEESEA